MTTTNSLLCLFFTGQLCYVDHRCQRSASGRIEQHRPFSFVWSIMLCCKLCLFGPVACSLPFRQHMIRSGPSSLLSFGSRQPNTLGSEQNLLSHAVSTRLCLAKYQFRIYLGKFPTKDVLKHTTDRKVHINRRSTSSPVLPRFSSFSPACICSGHRHHHANFSASHSCFACIDVRPHTKGGVVTSECDFIFTDDQDAKLNSLDYMPSVRKHLLDEGTHFQDHYCTVALCCPSRVSLWTGKAAHNTNVTNVVPTYGICFIVPGR